MESTGRYVVRYEPSDSRHEYLQTRIEMSISDEATFDDMANFFDAFLKAAGFVYDGELQVVNPEKDTYFTDFANFDFGDRVIYGGQGTDTISFGAAQAVDWPGYAGNDVISFG